MKMRSRCAFCFFLLAATLLTFLAIKSHAQTEPTYPINWINQLRVSTNGSILTMTNGSAWSAGAISSNVLVSNTDGWIEFSGTSGANYIGGLASTNAIDYNKFANAIFIDHANNSYTTYEGNTATAFGSWQIGDVFEYREKEVAILGAGVVITSVNADTRLKVEGSIGALIVKGNILVNDGHASNITAVLVVHVNAMVDVKINNRT